MSAYSEYKKALRLKNYDDAKNVIIMNEDLDLSKLVNITINNGDEDMIRFFLNCHGNIDWDEKRMYALDLANKKDIYALVCDYTNNCPVKIY